MNEEIEEELNEEIEKNKNNNKNNKKIEKNWKTVSIECVRSLQTLVELIAQRVIW